MRSPVVAWVLGTGLAACGAAALAEAKADTTMALESAERQAIQAVVEAAYVRGVHAAFDPLAMRRGFHPDFRMLVLREGKLEGVTLDEWIARLEKFAKQKPDAPKPRIEHSFALTEFAGHAAVARVELRRDGRHVFSDFLSLYKFADGWRIVSKTFYAYPS